MIQQLINIQPLMLSRAIAFTRNINDAWDLLQDTNEHILLKINGDKKIPGEIPAFRSWAYKVMHNLFIDQIRKNGRKPFIISADTTIEATAVEQNTLASAEGEKISAYSIINRLSNQNLRKTLCLKYLGFTDPEIAERMNVTPSVVRGRKRYARLNLAKLRTA